MNFLETIAREITEWPNNATHAVVTKIDAIEGRYIGIRFTECGPPVWNGENWTIIGDGCGMDVFWLPEHNIKKSFGCKPSEENIVSKYEWLSARAAYLASIQPAPAPEIMAVVDNPANPWRRNRGRKTPPVADGVMVDYKLRDDMTCDYYSDLAEDLIWSLDGHGGDIMQWRYAEPQQAKAKPMAQTIDQVIDNAEAAAATAFNPIALRDEYKRITLECEELSQQMGKLTDRMGEIEAVLRAEGFALVIPE